MNRMNYLLAVMLMGPGLPGCLVGGGAGEPDSVSFRLSLEDLGLEDAAPAIGHWMEWLDDPGPGNPAFDLGAAGSGFFMALDLTGHALSGELDFEVDGAQQVLLSSDSVEINLKVSECTGCVFSALIFWEETVTQTRLSTFIGQSEPFDVIPDTAVDPVDLDAYLAPTGSIRCRVRPNGYQGLLTVAAYDVEEHVILPPFQGMTYGETIDIVIEDVPVGRAMNVLVKQEEQTSYDPEPVNPQWQELKLEQTGEEALVEFSL